MLVNLCLEARRGPMGRPPALQLALWVDGDPADNAGRLTAVERGRGLAAREGRLSRAAMDDLEARLRATGFGERAVRVRERVDTSDSAGSVRLRAQLDGTEAELLVPMMSSGVEGPDADALRDFLGALLDAAGVTSDDVRFAVTGT